MYKEFMFKRRALRYELSLHLQSGCPVSSLLIKCEMWVSFVAVRTMKEFRLVFLFWVEMTEPALLKLQIRVSFLFNDWIQSHSLILYTHIILAYHNSCTACLVLCARDTRRWILWSNMKVIWDSGSQGNDNFCCHHTPLHTFCGCFILWKLHSRGDNPILLAPTVELRSIMVF